MKYIFSEVLNDLVNYFFLGDMKALCEWKQNQGLLDDLASEFTSNNSIDQAMEEGLVLPMEGIENYPYTIIFDIEETQITLLQKENRIQFHYEDYYIKVEHETLVLFTWHILHHYTMDAIEQYITQQKLLQNPIVSLANGWYHISILGGETLQNDIFEPTIEFILHPIEEPDTHQDMIYHTFKINSSSY